MEKYTIKQVGDELREHNKHCFFAYMPPQTEEDCRRLELAFGNSLFEKISTYDQPYRSYHSSGEDIDALGYEQSECFFRDKVTGISIVTNDDFSHYEFDIDNYHYFSYRGYELFDNAFYSFHYDRNYHTLNFSTRDKSDVLSYREKHWDFSNKKVLFWLGNVFLSDCPIKSVKEIKFPVDNKKDYPTIAFRMIREKGIGHVYGRINSTEELKAELDNFAIELEEKKAKEISSNQTNQQNGSKTVPVSDQTLKYGIDDLKNYVQTAKKNDIDIIISGLIAVRDSGVSLTPEQISLIEIYERYTEFKDKRNERAEGQIAARKDTMMINSKKAEQLNSLEDPNNPAVKRDSEIAKEREIIELLLSLKALAPNMLSLEQKQLIEHYKMLDFAKSIQHQVDEGMDPKIRNWYVKKYNDEGNGRIKR